LRFFAKKYFREHRRVGWELDESWMRVDDVVWERWECSERVLKNTKVLFFQQSWRGGPEGPLFRVCCKNLQEAGSWLELKWLQSNLSTPSLPLPCADAHNTNTGVWGLGLWVRHTDPEDVSSPEGPRVRERIALRTLTSL
jgi:hypothetical protein